jgi:hypothetical protein
MALLPSQYATIKMPDPLSTGNRRPEGVRSRLADISERGFDPNIEETGLVPLDCADLLRAS